MAYTELFTEGHELLAKIDPQILAGVTTTGYVSLANFHRWAIVIQTGIVGATVTLAVWQATSTAGDDAVFAGATNLTAADDNQVIVIDCRSEQLNVNSDYDCIALIITSAGRPYINATVWGMEPRYRPVATTLLDAVVTA